MANLESHPPGSTDRGGKGVVVGGGGGRGDVSAAATPQLNHQFKPK